jgi:addiction module HigA family antidote
MAMKNPAHPGGLIKYDCLEPLNLTVTAAAKALGVSRQALSNVINGNAGVTAEMAIRLSQAFGGTPEVWIRMQAAYDLAQAQKKKIKVQPLEPA